MFILIDYCLTVSDNISGIFRISSIIYQTYSVMVFNATFNNISAISWQSFLLVEETGVPGYIHRPVPSKNYAETREGIGHLGQRLLTATEN
jgi:hypothetical protein